MKKQQKRKDIGVPFDAKLLISVGELSIRKNHKIVIEALNKINDKGVYYAIVGKGELKEDLERIDKTGRLVLLGFRTDIVELLHASDLFVFPSIQEGLPVALMEAFVSKKICIASKIRGNTDLISANSSGYLFDLNDDQAILVTIIEALSRLYENVDLREVDIDRYSIKSIIKQIRDIYFEID